MPISMTQHAPQMPSEAYEQIIANLGRPFPAPFASADERTRTST